MKPLGRISIIFCILILAGVFAMAGGNPGDAGSGAAGPLNCVYWIQGARVRLVGGVSETPAAPGSAAMIRTSVLGQPVAGDLDGDGDDDAALVLVHDPGGSGTFYYLAAAQRAGGVFRGTNAVLLGDRIAVKDFRIRDGAVAVVYAGRRPEAPMSAVPTVIHTARLTLIDGRLTVAEAPGAKP